jgi:hypothetical protein
MNFFRYVMLRAFALAQAKVSFIIIMQHAGEARNTGIV